jgi:hypothetical protein
MWADTLREEVGGGGGGLAMEIKSFLGLEMARAELEISCDNPLSPPSPSNGSARIKKHYARGRINHRCIGGFMNTRGQSVRVIKGRSGS